MNPLDLCAASSLPTHAVRLSTPSQPRRHSAGWGRELCSALLLALPLLGCGGDPFDALDLSTFASPRCTADGFLAVAGLTPASAVDYLALRRVVFDNVGGPPSTTYTVDSTGTACASAVNRGACEAALAGLDPRAGFHQDGTWMAGSYSYLVATAGDSIQSVTDRAALLRFSAPIDQAQEALIWVWSVGYDVSCTDKSQGAVRSAADGFEILTRYRSPGLTGVPRSIYQKLIQVRSDGTMSELMSKLVGRS